MAEIDFHAHILPGCDHGSSNLETSLRQIALAKAAGVDVVCATSHFYGHQSSVEHFLDKRARCWLALREHLAADDPKVICLVLMALMALNQHGDTVAIINKKERFVILAIVFLCLIATMFVEFITWTPRSALRIEGVQGRYFIPLIPLVFLATENRKVLREKHLEDRTILTVFLLMQVFTVDHIMVLTKLQ